jgi:hypothetical protein
MPVVFRYEGYRFFFFSNEGNPLEPCHIHVRKADALAKFWISKHDVTLAESYGLSSSELRKLHEIIQKNQLLIERTWHDYFEL